MQTPGVPNGPFQGLSTYPPLRDTQRAQMRRQWHRPLKTLHVGTKSDVPERYITTPPPLLYLARRQQAMTTRLFFTYRGGGGVETGPTQLSEPTHPPTHPLASEKMHKKPTIFKDRP